MTTQEIKDEYAIEQGFDDWDSLLDEFVILYYTKECNELGACKWMNNHENKVFELVQQEQQKVIAENAKVEIKVTSNEESSIVKEYSNEDGSIKVSQSSIINENNIIR